MKHILFSSSLLFAGGTILMSCSSDELFGTRENVKRIEASICDFVMEDGATRTSHTLGGNGYEAVWATGDVLGIYPLGGDQVAFPISDGVGTTLAKFDGGAWALRGTYKYAAYYPFSTDNYTISETAIPVSYLGQTQAANNSVTHFGGYDFMAAAATNPDASGSVTLPFKHLSSYLILPLTLPKAGTYTQLTLTSSNGEFITKGTVDLSAPSPIITATETSSSISMNLDNIVLTADNLVLTANMLIAPVNLTGSTITITVTDSNGATYTNTEKAWTRSAAFVANTTYKASRTLAGSGTGGSIEGGGGMEEDGEEDTTPYLTFKADATQTLKMSKAVATLEYSVNNGAWAELGTNTVTFGGSNGDLQLRGKSSMGTASGTTVYSYSIISFGNSSSQVSCSGDIRTLVDYENYQTADCSNARFCYLFKDCASLVTTPELPAMSLADHCYYEMFSRCKSLTAAPELPATTLANDCYSSMFYACTSLITAPELPATTLAKNCYENMFNNCILLATAPELPATTLADHCYTNMFAVCTSLTTAPELPAKTMVNGCYSGMFSDCTSLSTAPVLSATTLANNCYSNMFSGCTSLTIAPELPAKSLANGCYGIMFYGCTSLSTAPVLQATTLAESCYASMFAGCTSLTTAPELPVTTLAEHCYEDMFSECTSLTTAPALPATTLAENCYSGMFINCTSLTVAPELPATTLANDCYYSMFYGCTSLTKAPELPATTLAENCYSGMFSDCTSLVTAPELPATTLVESCYASMFSGCTSLNYIKMLATDITASSCLYNWTRGVASSGTFVKNPAATWDRNGVSGIPTGWTVRNAYPKYNGHEYVDLGIKDEQGRTIYWATCNIGAENPEDAGLYFAWGETVGYNKDTKHSFTYTPDSETDGNGVLKPEYDAAYVNWGGSWHMPTFDEWCNLYDACYLEWVTHYKGVSINGLVLYKAKAESDKGKFSNNNPSLSTNYSVYNDVHIFLPAAGYFTGDALGNSYFAYSGTEGKYWSSSLSIMGSGMDYRGTDADHFHFHSTNYMTYNTRTKDGLTIRPVCVASE